MSQKQGHTRNSTDSGEPALFVNSSGVYAPVTLDANGRLPVASAASSGVSGSSLVATNLFLATVAGSASLSKAKWPGAYTVTLPTAGSGTSGIAAMTEAAATVGGVFSPDPSWGSVLLDFAGVGAADATTVVEIGKLNADATMPQVLCSASLKTITTSGTFTANFNPFTGAAVSSTTFRLYDLATLTNRGNLGQVLVNAGGTEDNSPMQLVLSVTEASYYYVLITTLGVATSVLCAITPQP